jgi:hypothetical protein
MKSGTIQVILFVFFNMIGINFLNAQPLVKNSQTGNTIIYELGNNSTAKIGVGYQFITPTSRFHISAADIMNTGAFKINANILVGGLPVRVGYLESYVFKSGQMYGIYQKDTNGYSVLNYFQDPVGIGCDPIGDNLLTVNGTAKIYNDLFLGDQSENPLGTETNIFSTATLNFMLTPPSNQENPTYYKVLSLRSSGASNSATVLGKLTTETFMMTTNPGQNKVLTSDIQGNGTWKDVKSFNDSDWIETYNTQKIVDPTDLNELSLYLNPKYTNVGIGVMKPQSTLAVNGKVTAKEFEATLDGWPDYVFDNTYTLRPLKDLENYIQLNKHLPEIPTEKEVLENGVKLGEMNALLVKKVEELTLYLISMQKEIEELKAERPTK